MEESDKVIYNLPRHYQVNVVIIEGRHLALKDVNTKVNISIGKKKKTIHAKSNKTDSPYYNDFCVFQFYLPLSVLLDEILNVRVYQLSRLGRKLVGSFSVELSTVWSQPNHQFYHKWGVLTDPKKPTKGLKGFLKCDIAILSKGIFIQASGEPDDQDEIEENLLVPQGGIKDRHRAKITFSIFRADSFSPYSIDKYDPNLSLPYVRITYAGNVRKTSIAKHRNAPVWNEELTFPDLVPPLCQNILIEVCDRRQPVRKDSLANTNIEIKALYEDGEDGFLPTFGPNFLYLYEPFKKFAKHRNCCAMQSSFTYMCRLLLAIRTEVVNYAEDVKVQKVQLKPVPKPITPLIESIYFQYKKFILFATIFDVLLFDATHLEKNINFRLTLGPRKNTKEIKEKPMKEKRKNKEKVKIASSELENPTHLKVITTCNMTPNMKCTIKNDYGFITFSGKYPCVHVFGEWPDSLRRMYRSNIIKRAVQNCVNEINKIKRELEYESEGQLEHSRKLKDTLADLSKSCEGILLLTNVTTLEDTNLYRERKRVYHREIAEIAKKTKIASHEPTLKVDDILNVISNHLSILTKYAQDPENSFPDTEIWMKNGKITTQCRIRTEDIVYSKDLQERGMTSGKPQTVIIRGEKEKIKAKLEIFAWFGLADDFMQCLNMLPAGYQHEHPVCESSADSRIPSQIIYQEVHHFECRVHIFQAKIMVGFDDTGLADPFVRVIVLEQNQVTQVRKATLSPVWNETLLFTNLKLYGPKNFIKENSIKVTVEVYDKEKAKKAELIGRSFVTPVVKLSDEKYEPPNFPPRLRWEGIQSEYSEVGKILMVTELLELSENLKDLYSFSSVKKSTPLEIPKDIRPVNAQYRLEIIFWGIRGLKKKNKKVQVVLQCGETVIQSEVLKNAKHNLNFPSSVRFVLMELPEDPEYSPPVSLKLFHTRTLAVSKSYIANCIIPSVRSFYCPFSKTSEKEVRIQITQEIEKKKEKLGRGKEKVKGWAKKAKNIKAVKEKVSFGFAKLYNYGKCKLTHKCQGMAYEFAPIEEEETLDWWTRYHASIEPLNYPGIPTFKVYTNELEAQPEFKGFSDYLHTFNMITGHDKKTKGGILVARVKAVLKLYKWPLNDAEMINSKKVTSKEGMLSYEPTNAAVKFVVRVYVICGKHLSARDIYGKSDPYLCVQLGDQSHSDRDNYVPKQLNPTFGKCFEFNGIFPRDSLLKIKVLDYDVSHRDDLIGETTIDVENRYYSKHHATCGVSKHFEKEGYGGWKDIFLPTDILKKVCRHSNYDEPVYENDKVRIGGHEIATGIPKNMRLKEQIQALTVLHKWHEIPVRGFHIVPEHVETRSLFHPALPGIEQGKLELWVDIFPADFRYMPPKVDIKPRVPIPMELRAIVWNVDDVVLDDKSLFFREKMSDIYVRGWILSLEEDMQKTDVHYRSLNGEGNFNWRFIFHFNYIPTERKMVMKKKINAFDMHPEERKHYCKLEIQIWDNDAFGDDYLGTLILELSSMPRGAKLSNRCTLKMLAPNYTKINLFKIQRTRGWWPFRRLREKQHVGNEFELTGKIDLELEILTEAEAKLSPAGKGREEPGALPPPDRPATSFNWMISPLKTFRYIIWKKIRKVFLISCLFAILGFFVLAGLYAFPNYLVKRMIGA